MYVPFVDTYVGMYVDAVYVRRLRDGNKEEAEESREGKIADAQVISRD